MKTLGIGLLGCGTVGRQVALDLRDQADFLAGQAGACFELKRVAVRDLSVDRGLSFKEGVLTDDPMSVSVVSNSTHDSLLFECSNLMTFDTGQTRALVQCTCDTTADDAMSDVGVCSRF